MIAKMIAAGRVRGGGVVKRVRRPGEESETGEGCDVEGKLHSIVHDRCRFRDPPPPRAADPTPARICVGTPVCTSRRRSPRPCGRGAASGDGRVSPFRRPRPPPGTIVPATSTPTSPSPLLRQCARAREDVVHIDTGGAKS